MARSIFLKEDIDVMIVSSGGVGTTFLSKAIGTYLKTNDPDNKDGLKHLPVPPINRSGKEIKAIYVFGDPLLATVSLFRRRYHHAQSVATQRFYPKTFIVPVEMPLPTYVAGETKGVFHQRSFENWRELPRSYPVLFVRYDDIHEELKTIQAFLGLPDQFIKDFPPKRERTSSLEAFGADVVAGLERFYGDFSATIAQQPAAWIAPANPALFFPLQRPYLRAYHEAVGYLFPLYRKLFRKLKV